MKKNLFISSFSYSFVQYAMLGLSFFKGIYSAKYLGPALLGTYSIMLLILEYLRFSNLGLISAMNLESSVNKSNTEYTQKVINTTFTYLCWMGIAYVILAILIRYGLGQFVANDILPYFFVIAYAGFVGQLKIFAIIYARLNEKYNWINLIELTSNATQVVIVILFVQAYKMDAVIGAIVLSSTLTFIICGTIIFRKKIKFIKLELSFVKSLVVIGIPILLYTLCQEIFLSIDRLTIIYFLDRESLGFFSLSRTIVSSTLILLSSFTFLYYPKVLHAFNLNHFPNTSDLVAKFVKYSALLNAISVGIGIIGMILIKPFISIFLPEYHTSILLYQILILAITFDRCAYFADTFLVSNKMQMKLVWTILFMALICIGLNFLAVHFGFGLLGIVYATLLTLFLYGSLKILVMLNKIKMLKTSIWFAIYKKYIFFTCFSLLILNLSGTWIPLLIPLYIALYFKEICEISAQIRTIFFKRAMPNESVKSEV